MKLHMCMNLRAKCEVSSRILTSFRQGWYFSPLTPPLLSKRSPKKPTQIRINREKIKNVVNSFEK